MDSLLSPRQLNDQQQMRLLVVRVLCHYCDLEYDPNVTILDLPRPSDDLAPKTVKKRLEKMLYDEDWDANKAFDLQLV